MGIGFSFGSEASCGHCQHQGDGHDPKATVGLACTNKGYFRRKSLSTVVKNRANPGRSGKSTAVLNAPTVRRTALLLELSVAQPFHVGPESLVGQLGARHRCQM
ncbi:hypothetical protein [Paraburkholderia sp. GAS334]|uniref:hypothetical protein n=1 Tax=Paraburkholderia sp. GAS334 TaxID=3035131 RepID=UPI003D25176E